MYVTHACPIYCTPFKSEFFSYVGLHLYAVLSLLFRLLAVGVDCLLVAACTGDSDTIRTLVNEEGFSPSHEFQQGVTALHEACESGHKECVDALIELGAEVNKQVYKINVWYMYISTYIHACTHV